MGLSSSKVHTLLQARDSKDYEKGLDVIKKNGTNERFLDGTDWESCFSAMHDHLFLKSKKVVFFETTLDAICSIDGLKVKNVRKLTDPLQEHILPIVLPSFFDPFKRESTKKLLQWSVSRNVSAGDWRRIIHCTLALDERKTASAISGDVKAFSESIVQLKEDKSVALLTIGLVEVLLSAINDLRHSTYYQQQLIESIAHMWAISAKRIFAGSDMYQTWILLYIDLFQMVIDGFDEHRFGILMNLMEVAGSTLGLMDMHILGRMASICFDCMQLRCKTDYLIRVRTSVLRVLQDMSSRKLPAESVISLGTKLISWLELHSHQLHLFPGNIMELDVRGRSVDADMDREDVGKLFSQALHVFRALFSNNMEDLKVSHGNLMQFFFRMFLVLNHTFSKDLAEIMMDCIEDSDIFELGMDFLREDLSKILSPKAILNQYRFEHKNDADFHDPGDEFLANAAKTCGGLIWDPIPFRWLENGEIGWPVDLEDIPQDVELLSCVRNIFKEMVTKVGTFFFNLYTRWSERGASTVGQNGESSSSFEYSMSMQSLLLKCVSVWKPLFLHKLVLESLSYANIRLCQDQGDRQQHSARLHTAQVRALREECEALMARLRHADETTTAWKKKYADKKAALDAIAQQFLCLVCFEVMIPPSHRPCVFICGHVVCEQCRPQLRKCPVCRGPVQNAYLLRHFEGTKEMGGEEEGDE